MVVLRINTLFGAFICLGLLLTVIPARMGRVNAMDEQGKASEKVVLPTSVEAPFLIQAKYLRAWNVVREDFLQTFDLEEGDETINEYQVSFYEEDYKIVINAGRDPGAPGSLGLERSVQYHVLKSNYELVNRILFK